LAPKVGEKNCGFAKMGKWNKGIGPKDPHNWNGNGKKKFNFLGKKGLKAKGTHPKKLLFVTFGKNLKEEIGRDLERNWGKLFCEPCQK